MEFLMNALDRFPQTQAAARQWVRENGGDISDAFGNSARNDAFFKLVRAWMAPACAVIPITSVLGWLTGNLTIFQFILALGVGLGGALAVVCMTQMLERMLRPTLSTHFTPVMGSFLSLVGTAMLLDALTPRRDAASADRGRTASERATVLFYEALRAPISHDVTLTAGFCDPISGSDFTPRCIAYVLDDSATAPISEASLARLYGPSAVQNNGKNPFTNLPLTRIAKVRLLLTDDAAIASRVPPTPPASTDDQGSGSRTGAPPRSEPDSEPDSMPDITVSTFPPLSFSRTRIARRPSAAHRSGEELARLLDEAIAEAEPETKRGEERR
jgi:hypothetical protein